MTSTLLRCAALATLSTPLLAQDGTLPFPAQLQGVPSGEVLELEPDPTLLAALTEYRTVRLAGAPTPWGQVDLELERLAFDPRSVGVYVDGRRADYDPGDLTLWKGSIAGVEGSRVQLAFSSHGSYGWIHDGVTTTHVSSFAAEGGDWSRARLRIYSDAALAAAPRGVPGDFCQTGTIPGPGGPGTINPWMVSQPTAGAATKLECRMAVETDWQLWNIWKDLQAEQNYVLALIGAVSDRYDEQVDVRITFPYVQFYTTQEDPWTTQDSGGGSGDLLGEFQGRWAGNIPAGAHIAHFLSGAGLGGGVAWVGVLCNQTYGFAVSGNINGGVTFPVQQGSNTWDFFVTAHETGHNFGTLHTHDYCPPLDECASNCNGVTNCTNQGTNMSYCHGCPGGMNNITTYFHPTVVGVMRAGADGSCIPDLGSGTPVVLFADDFESGSLAAGGWVTGNQAPQVLTAAAKVGTYGCRIRRLRYIEKALDTTGYQNIVVKLWRRTKNYDAGEELRLRWWDGNSWNTLEDASNPGWATLTFHLPSGAANNPSFKLRFRSAADLGDERGDVDEVVVTGEL